MNLYFPSQTAFLLLSPFNLRSQTNELNLHDLTFYFAPEKTLSETCAHHVPSNAPLLSSASLQPVQFDNWWREALSVRARDIHYDGIIQYLSTCLSVFQIGYSTNSATSTYTLSHVKKSCRISEIGRMLCKGWDQILAQVAALNVTIRPSSKPLSIWKKSYTPVYYVRVFGQQLEIGMFAVSW